MADETHPARQAPGAEEAGAAHAGVIAGEEVTPDKDETLDWILKGLGRGCSFAVRCRAGAEAGADEGQWFYRLFFAECSIAVRADCLRAYVASVSKLASLPKLAELIGTTKLQNPAQLTSTQLRESLMVEQPTWVLLSAGEAPVPEGAASYCIPGSEDQPLARENLEGWSESLQELIDADGFDEEQVRRTRSVAALPGEVIGHFGPMGAGTDGRDVFGRPLPWKGLTGRPALGANVEEQDGALVATEYGYVFLREGRLAVISPVWLEVDNSRAYWLDLDRRPRPVTPELGARWLVELEVVEGIDEESLRQAADRICEGAAESSLMPIAEAQPAEHGDDAQLEILVDLEKRRGVLRPDGSIDLSKVRFDANVKADQEVARLSPPTQGTPGRDLTGTTIPARDGKTLAVKAGPGVRIEDGVRGFLHFYAERDGALKAVPGEVSVTDTLVIDSDVGFDTGNLEYAGEIVVHGSVGQGFTVKAGSSVYVFGSVDNGATIVAGGDVIIGQGLAGRRTRIACRGQLRAGYIHDARVRAGSDILVGNHIVQGILHADGLVQVEEREGPRGGTISGGEVWGLAGIRLSIAGSQQHNRTCLTAGLDPEAAKKLDLISRKLEESTKLISRQLQRFGLKRVDVKAIQQRLVASTGPQKKVLARAAKQLGEVVQAHQALLKERQAIEAGAAGGLATAFVEAGRELFPGVVVRIGDSQREVKSPMKMSRFQLRGGVLAIR